jgi:hypothetical protein
MSIVLEPSNWFYLVFKHRMKGVYQHCNHLHRKIAELDLRYNNRVALGVEDIQRAERFMRSAYTKRLS